MPLFLNAVPPLAGGVSVVVRDRDDVVLVALALGLPQQRPHPDQVDDAAEVGLDAPRQLDHDGLRAQPVHDHLDAAVKLRADPVHLVHETDPRHVVAVSLPPHGLGLGLNAGHCVEHGHRAVQHAEGTLDLDGEVNVPGGVDDVDGVVAPRRGRGRGGDGDPPLLLLLHPVHGGGALMNLTDLVVDTGVEENPLSRRRLARVDMRHDPDVADLGEIYARLGGHL
jgi:hypothetical protein